MTGNRKRRDLLPPPDFDAVSPALTAGTLSFTAVNEAGTESKVINLVKLPGAVQLRAELVSALATLNGPQKRWRSVYSVWAGYQVVSAFLRWLDSNGHQLESVADISTSIWDGWVLHNGGAQTEAGSNNIRTLRTILLCTSCQSQALAQAMSRRVGTPVAPIQQSYPEADYQRIRRSARKAVHAASRRISTNFEIILRFQNGAAMSGNEAVKAQALLEVMQYGVPQSKESYTSLHAWKVSKGLVRRAQRSLFLTPHEAWACAVLLAAEAGWNRSVIDRLAVPDNSTGAADDVEVYTVSLNKPRRGSRQHSTTTVLGDSGPGRALTWLIAATEPARTVLEDSGCATDRLLIYGRHNNYAPQRRFTLGIPECSSIRRKGWDSVDLHPISLQKLRRTHQVLFDRSPTQNTRTTHENIYLRNDSTAAEQAPEVVASGLQDALRRAEDLVKMRMLTDEQASDDIRSGSGDTVIAACVDYEHHPDTGTTCTDSFLSCLGCVNAIATPRHLPRLVLTHAGLAELGSTIDSTEWVQRWETHYRRLSSLLERHTTQAERTAAMTSATDDDRLQVTRLLDGGFSVA